MRMFSAISASKSEPTKHSLQGTGDPGYGVETCKQGPWALETSLRFPQAAEGSLLREVHVLQLPHVFLVFFLEFLCCFILRSMPHRQSRSELRGDKSQKKVRQQNITTVSSCLLVLRVPPTPLPAALTQVYVNIKCAS